MQIAAPEKPDIHEECRQAFREPQDARKMGQITPKTFVKLY